MNATAIDHGFRVRGWHVLAAFVVFFGIVIAVDTGFVIMSIRSFPGQVSVTPYEDGLVYDRKLAQMAAQDRLGWRAAAAAEPDAVVVEM
jgi:nitrogen fixation protein FixH